MVMRRVRDPFVTFFDACSLRVDRGSGSVYRDAVRAPTKRRDGANEIAECATSRLILGHVDDIADCSSARRRCRLWLVDVLETAVRVRDCG